MGLTNKNMLVAGDFYEQTINLIPESISNEEKLQSSVARYKGFTEQITAINPRFTFDYSRHPALTIMDGENVLAVAVSPELRNSHLGTYACASAVFNSAFADKKTFDDVAKSLALMGGDIQHFNVRKDLGDEYSAVAGNMFTSVKNGTQNAQKLSYLNEIYVEPEILSANYIKIRDAETEAYLARTKTPATSISYAGEPDVAEAELKRQHDKAIAENKEAVRNMVQNTDADLADDLKANAARAKTKLDEENNKVDDYLKQRNEIGKKDGNWLDELIKEKGFDYKVSKTPLFGEKYAHLQDVVVADANQNELFRFKTGLSNRVVMTHAGLMNPDARAIAQEYAIRKGFDPIHIRLPKLDSQQYSNTELVSFMKNSVIEFHENFDVPFHKIKVPKQYQKLFDDHVAEYLKGKTEIGFSSNAEPDDAPEAAELPAVPVQPSSQSASHDKAPLAATPVQEAVELPTEPVQAATVIEKPPAPTEPVAASVEPEVAKPAPVVEQGPAKKTMAIAVSNGLFALPSKKNEGKYILWGKEDVVDGLSSEALQINVEKLCKHHNIQPSDFIGFWKTESKVSASPVKKGDFLEAKDLVRMMSGESANLKEFVVSKPDQFDNKPLSEIEANIAKALGTPEILDSSEHKQRKAILDGSFEKADEINLDSALADLQKSIESKPATKSLFPNIKADDKPKVKLH